MTDEVKGAVTGPAADDARDQAGRRRMTVLAAIAGLSLVAFAVTFFLLYAREGDLQQQVTALSSSAQDNHAAAQQLAEQVRKLGGTPTVQPPPGPTAVTGPVGPAGAAGRGITGTAISAGHLFVSYTDGTTEDKGQVAGATGVKGSDGRGITGSNATSGHLVLSYSDGSTTDAGQVVGKDGATGATGPVGAAGRGVASLAENTNNHLIITYTDGTTQDIGPLPAGPPGPTGPQGVQGPAGSPPAGWTWTDTLGRNYTCTRNASSPDSAPTYTCTAAPLLSTAARPGH